MKLDVCAYICVFNEEARIRYTLESFKWCNQIIVVDKNSEDHTREIAQSYGAEVYRMENMKSYDSSEFRFLKNCRCEWLMIVTASDIISPKLVFQIKNIIENDSEKYDSISIPYHRYILGIYNKRSPWYSENCLAVYKKDIVDVNLAGVHDAISIKHKKVYEIKFDGDNALSHLTHESVDVMMDRHLRYLRGEGMNYKEETMHPAFRPVWLCIKDCLLHKKSFLGGWDNVALLFSYLSYHLMSFVYKWESTRSHASDVYRSMREQNSMEWNEYYKSSSR